jgi:hypothetical protein
MIQRINETNWFFKKINTIGKSLANVTNRKERGPKLIKLDMKKRIHYKYQ